MNEREIRHRRSIRLSGYDYSTAGNYYVTICIQNRECLLGEIINGEMKLNEVGQMVEKIWLKLPEKFLNIYCESFIVMPNHIHGIINILPNVGAGSPRPNDDLVLNISTKINQKKRTDDPVANKLISKIGNPLKKEFENPFGRGDPAPTALGKIIAFFKYQTTKRINAIQDPGIQKLWQRNYYEHIIRNEIEFKQIREYIAQNPNKWDEDSENPAFIK